VSFRAPRNYAYVTIQIFDESFKFNAVFISLPVVTSLLPSTIKVRPPPSDLHVLHIPLELHNLRVTYFEPLWLTCATHVSHVGLELSCFWTALE
jgi:hypothetical protein